MAEALERLFIEIYCNISLGSGLESSINQLLNTLQKARNGEMGAKAKYWVTFIELVDLQRQLHHAVSRNDFDLRLDTLNTITPLCFAFNKLHYSRYGSYYIKQLQNLDITHPGAKKEIEQYGISVRRNNIGFGQSVDLAGEQTYTRSTKTSGTLYCMENMVYQYY